MLQNYPKKFKINFKVLERFWTLIEKTLFPFPSSTLVEKWLTAFL